MYKIRFMTREDLMQVVEIDKEAFPTQWPPTNYRSELQNRLAHYLVVYVEGPAQNFAPAITAPASRGFLSWLKQVFRAGTPPVIPTTDTIVGFAGCWIMADETHITEIAVRESYRNRGIGHLLLIALIELGIRYKANIATLEVRISNSSAQLLYKECGFENVGERKAYYSDNREDAYIMTASDVKSIVYQEKLAQLRRELMEKWNLRELPQVEGEDAATK